MQRKIVVAVTIWCVLISSVAPPVLAHSDGDHHSTKIKGEGDSNAAPGVSAGGDASTAELGSIFFKGIVNTKSGKGRGTVKGDVPNESGEKQSFRDEPTWVEFLLAIILIIMFGGESTDIDIAVSYIKVAAKGKTRGKVSYTIPPPPA